MSVELTQEEEAAYFYGALGDAFGYGAASSYSNKPTLSRGSRDVAAVKEMQNALMAKGYNLAPYGADGDFGPTTEAAVKKLQTDNKLPATGVVGSAEWGLLLGATTAKEKQDKTLQTLDTIFQGFQSGLTAFAPMFSPKQEYSSSPTPSASGGHTSAYAPPATGMSTGAKVGIGVIGLVVIGGGIYLLVSRRG